MKQLYINFDGDEYNDQEEYYRGSDPYTYEVEVEVMDPSGQFWKGVVFGDFVEDEEVDGYVLVGQIAGGFIPVVADGRDVIANVSKGDFLMAILSGAGFFPGAGDAAKALGDLGQVIAKLADDTPTIARLLIKTADEHPHLVKLFGQNEIVESAVEEAVCSPAITRLNLDKMLRIADNTGFVKEPASEVLKRAFQKPLELSESVWSLPACARGKVIDLHINKHDGIRGLGENFPVFDRLENRTLINTKSLDTAASTYRDPKKLERRIQSYIDKMNNFEAKYPKVNTPEGFAWGDNPTLHDYDYDGWKLELVLPAIPLTSEQQAVIEHFIDTEGISVIFLKGQD